MQDGSLGQHLGSSQTSSVLLVQGNQWGFPSAAPPPPLPHKGFPKPTPGVSLLSRVSLPAGGKAHQQPPPAQSGAKKLSSILSDEQILSSLRL